MNSVEWSGDWIGLLDWINGLEWSTGLRMCKERIHLVLMSSCLSKKDCAN